MRNRSRAFTTFETALGTMGAAWGPRGLTRLRLPERTHADLLAAMHSDLGDLPEAAAPAAVQADLDRIAAYLAGEGGDLSKIRIDLGEETEFRRAVYDAARGIGHGEVVSYGELAARAGSPGAARAVGGAMAKNRFPVVIPCHKVVAAGGRPGGFSAWGDLATKAKILALEGIPLPGKMSRPLPYDLGAATEHLRAADPALRRWIDRIGPCRLELVGDGTPYDHLVRAIVYQQLSGKAAATIHGRLLELFPRRRLGRPRRLLAVEPETLRGCGLSRAKTAAVRDLAAKVLDGTVPGRAAAAEMDDAELLTRLTAVKGIGRWSVEMFLLFGLGRPDVLADADLGLQKGAARLGRRKDPLTPKRLAARGARWAPYRSVASWYLWRIADGAATRG